METQTQENNWNNTEERFIAFIDIMGFKDMVARTAHEKIYEIMSNIKKMMEDNFANWVWENDTIKSITYSDSIMIYSKANRIVIARVTKAQINSCSIIN